MILLSKYHRAGKFGEFTLLKHFVKKIWQMNRSANELLIVITNLNAFSLANRRLFAKLSTY